MALKYMILVTFSSIYVYGTKMIFVTLYTHTCYSKSEYPHSRPQEEHLESIAAEQRRANDAESRLQSVAEVSYIELHFPVVCISVRSVILI